MTGGPGSGKSTLATSLARALNVPYVEMDALFHGPNWTPAQPADFSSAVSAAVAGPGWVIDGNYSRVRPIIRLRAQLIVALDLPRRVSFSRLLRRTLIRMATRTELWNGNTEQWSNLFSTVPEDNLLLWAATRLATYHQRAVDDENAWRAGGIAVIRLTSARQVARFYRHFCAGITTDL